MKPDLTDGLVTVSNVVVIPDEPSPKPSLARRAWRWLKGLFV